MYADHSANEGSTYDDFATLDIGALRSKTDELGQEQYQGESPARYPLNGVSY